MRHRLSGIFKKYEKILLSARSAGDDIGRKAGQVRYKTVDNIVKANFKRVQESLRVLEEYSRLDQIKSVQKIKKLRFEIYSLEKKYYEKN